MFTDTLLQRALPLQVLSRRGRGPHSYEVSIIFGKLNYTLHSYVCVLYRVFFLTGPPLFRLFSIMGGASLEL